MSAGAEEARLELVMTSWEQIMATPDDSLRTKDDITAVYERQSHLEERVGGVERELKHAFNAIERTNQAIEQTNAVMGKGFAELRNHIEAAGDRDNKRADKYFLAISDLRDKISSNSQVSWSLVLSCIAVVLVLIGGCVSFVAMYVAPVNQNVTENRTNLSEHRALPGHTEARIQLARLDERAKAAEQEITLLREHNLDSAAKYEQYLQEHNRLIADVTSIQKQQDRRWPHILGAAENKGRIDAVIENLRAAIEEALYGKDKE
jgi:hypothetical protein